jgi:hypothetical protein
VETEAAVLKKPTAHMEGRIVRALLGYLTMHQARFELFSSLFSHHLALWSNKYGLKQLLN